MRNSYFYFNQDKKKTVIRPVKKSINNMMTSFQGDNSVKKPNFDGQSSYMTHQKSELGSTPATYEYTPKILNP
jgi:hypothetical protein